MIIWFLFGAMCMLVVLFLAAYWKFMRLHQAAQQAWQQLENNLKNRTELIAPLSLFAASFNELERPFLTQLSSLKETCRQKLPLPQRVACENEVTQAFKKVFTAAMAHPEMTTHEQFVKLQNNIIQAEAKVQRSKRKYNSAARDFNTITALIPLNLIAQMFELSPYAYFDFDNSVAREP